MRGEDRVKQVVVRVQKRVRMGMKDELGLSYILSSSSDHMTIYLYCRKRGSIGEE